MVSRIVRGALGIVVLAAVVWVAARGAGPVPPLGNLLDPVNGAFGAALTATLPARASSRVPGLADSVSVRYDDRGVPHIFAATEPDAYRALGYVVARDRLFQIDLQARAASGRLTEWVGKQALPLDREMRNLGLPRAAEQKLAAIDTASMAWKVMTAFADGVNAYVAGLDGSRVPVEYKLLGVKPDRWQPIDAIHLFNRMGWTLSYSPGEYSRYAAASLVGDSAADALFPENTPIQEPIQPTGRPSPRDVITPIPAPGAGDTSARVVAALLRRVAPPGASDAYDPRHFASNNWAVAPSRSADGHALLANDPHLDLTLPSIWYETQLVVPGKLDVYGVTIPGAPGIVLGFNRDVAWGFTNTGADVVDYYREKVDNEQSPTKYLLDGVWKPLELRVETYYGKRHEVLAVDTVRYTHRGPLSHAFGAWVSMRWTQLEPSHEITAFYDAAHATSAQQFLDDMARSFYGPAQNMLVADRTGTIAIRSTGHFPLRPKGEDGMHLFDGTTSASDWTGYWPVDRYPQSVNPKQGYLASANQQPIDPSQRFAYLGDDRSYDPWRALDINQLLRRDSSVTVDDMRHFQTSTLSVRAQRFLPYFLAAARGSVHDSDTMAGAAVLEKWDGRYTRDNQGAVLFERAMQMLRTLTWDELRDPTGRRVATPSDAVMYELLQQPFNAWWDIRATRGIQETRDMILVRALTFAYDSVVKKLGPPKPDTWAWDNTAKVNIHHLLAIKPFSALDLVTDGGQGTLNPAPGGGGFGPSWRLVVDLGPQIKAWDTYPGGQSGNPASPEYANRIPQWLAGELSPVIWPSKPGDLPAAETQAVLTLRPGGRR